MPFTVSNPLVLLRRCWRRFKKSNLSKMADDERHRDQRDADSDRGEQLVDGIGQDEGAGPCSHLGLDHGLTEAQFAEQSSHVDPTGHEEVEHAQRHEGDADVEGHAHCAILFEDLL